MYNNKLKIIMRNIIKKEHKLIENFKTKEFVNDKNKIKR